MEHPFAPLPAIEPDSEAYWTACREGRLEMARCQACRWFVHPARPVCSRCRSRDVRPETLSGLATVVTYTVNHQRWMPGLEVPYVIAVVELVEQRNLRLTTNVVGCPPEAVRIGMPVKVTFRKVTDEVSLPIFAPDETPRPDAAVLRTTPETPPKRTDTAEVLSRPPRRVTSAERLERRAILSGVGQSAIGRRLFRGDMDLTVEAALRAIADAGLTPDDVDGIASYPGFMAAAPAGFAGPGIVEVQDALGLSVSWYQAGNEVPGQIGPVIAAALAVAAGLARHVLIYRTVSEATAAAGTGRLGIGAGSREIRGFGAYLIPYGAMSAANWIACHAVRHMHEYGTTREQLAAVALAGRKHAALNPDAVYREPLTLDDYLSARMVSWPFGLYDCDAPCDGSTAVIVSAADVDTAQLYDGFSFLTLAWLEALGFCGRGESGPFVAGGRLELGGALPTNTWGGQLSGGRLHGFGFLAEAIRQLRGTCGARQVPDCEVAVVANGGGPIAGCMLLTRA
jgi:acetyl-CoA acetyltransferase/uncharacterized OB-fold protein